MMMQRSIKSLAPIRVIMAVVLSCVVGGGYVGAEDRRPNFLFIIVDDQSPFELQLYNSRSKLATPNIDRLAKQGMVLDGAHQMGSWTGGVCTASRHMIMSGRTLWHCPDEPGRANNPNVSDPKLVPPGLVKWTLPAVFNGADYDTMRTCKKGNSYEAANSEFTIRRDATRRGGTDETGSAWHAEQVLDYLGMREADGARDPFLIYFGFSHPHDTRDGKQELLEKYGATNHTEKSSPPAVHPLQPALPSNYLPSHPFDFTHQEVRDEVRVRGVWKRRDEATIRNELGRQYACSENIDIQIGRVLERLESIGELENTYVFYTSDHGMAIGRHGLQGKQNLYEHTMRVPMIVRGPGIPAGVRKLGNIYLLDVFSTLCQLAEIETPVTNEGVSFADVLRGKQTTVRDVIYAAYSGGHKPGIRAVRRGDWKLIKYDSASTGSHHTQLFDLSENPLEFLPQHQDDVVAGMTGVKPTARQTNLAFDSRFASKRREMERLLQAEMRRLDDPYELWDQKEAANADHSHSKSDTLPGGASSTSVAGQKDARGVALKDNAAAKHGVADRHSGAKKRVASVKSNSAIETRSPMDAKRKPSGIADPPNVPGLERFAIYESTAPRPEHGDPVSVTLPLRLAPGSRIALVGNGLFERSQWFGNFEGLLHAQYPEHKLIVRHLAWSGDAVAIQPRPANFADTLQHLTREKVDVVFVALGGNESFAGRRGLADFRKELTRSLRDLQSKRFNGHTAAQVVLVSPTACENTVAVPAGDQNNERLEVYVAAMQEVAKELKLGFVDAFHSTRDAMHSTGDLTVNGLHLNEDGDRLFSEILFSQTFGVDPKPVSELIQQVIVDKNRQFFRRFRPLNTFYYTGGRSKTYGYLDFLPAMRNFDLMVANRDQKIWDLASGKTVDKEVDDSNVPSLPITKQSRGANRWMTAAEEMKAFAVDSRFEVNLFAGEEEFPDIANPIQMRWDSRGRLWVSCSTTYPHVYPGNEPNDKIVILEDVDGDGRADKSTVFADDLHIPLSFELGDGGVYVSEQPNLTFLKDTDGDDKADVRRALLSGFGTEDSHHSLHDFTFTPDGDLLFRESIFHHSQVETPHGTVRQQNSGWFRFDPRSHRLLSFGTYHSTNPWGVAFDDWGQHLASHPVYAEAFHALDPPYPTQHPSPKGLQAYSGVCGHQLIDFQTFPDELQGHFIKVRYKPTNRIEIHEWNEGEFGYREQYVGDLLFSSNLSFIPVDLQWGPRGALYVCDWYNPIKGHAQYSLRDERRDRHSGRIWRITAKDKPLLPRPEIDGASIENLLNMLKRPEQSIRMLVKRELGSRDPQEVRHALDQWVSSLDVADPRFRHHQLEAVWGYRWTGLSPFATHLSDTPAPVERDEDVAAPIRLLRELLSCNDHRARAGATKQLRYWCRSMDDGVTWLNRMANDPNGVVRMQAVIASSYVGTKESFDAVQDVFNHPSDGELQYAIMCSMGSRTLRPYWEDDPESMIGPLLRKAAKQQSIKEPATSARDAQFDRQKDVKRVKISCIPERMLFSVKQFTARPGQPVKLTFANPDATDHNLVIVQPNALSEVGMAANEMAKDPRNSKSDFVPRDKSHLILHAAKMIGPTRASLVDVLRFEAPDQPGIYPYVCTFPGHWVVMNGVMVVAESDAEADDLLAASKPKIVHQWTMDDFEDWQPSEKTPDSRRLAKGMTAFVKAGCSQCHVVAGHGVNLGPDLVTSIEKLRGRDLLQQMIDPSSQIHPDFQNHQFLLDDGESVVGVIVDEDEDTISVRTNLLTPKSLKVVRKDEVEFRRVSKLSPMPNGLLNVLTKQEILFLHEFVESGGFKMPEGMEHSHGH